MRICLLMALIATVTGVGLNALLPERDDGLVSRPALGRQITNDEDNGGNFESASRQFRGAGLDILPDPQQGRGLGEPVDEPTLDPTPVETPESLPEPAFIPEPAPQPVAPVVHHGLWAILVEVFGEELAPKWYRIANCETGRKLAAGQDPWVVNAGAANWTHGYFGIFQIWIGHGYDAGTLLADIRYGAQAAFALSRGGVHLTPWPICGFS